MKKKINIIFLLMILIMSLGIISQASASYQGTGFTHNIPDNYYDSYTEQEILDKYNDTYLVAEETSICTKVVDGDTIYLSNGDKVRLVGVNTPEKGATGYTASKEFVKKLCLNKQVSINIDDKKHTDKYGRKLAVVLVDGKNLNAMLLNEGLAEVMYIPPSEFYPYSWLDDSQTSAPSNSTTSNQQTTTLKSMESTASSSSAKYIGNSNSFKYHTKSCDDVDKMSEKNKVYFNSKEDAVNGGYIACKKCNP